MKRLSVAALVVSSGDDDAGLITERDVMLTVADQTDTLISLAVREIMDRSPETCDSGRCSPLRTSGTSARHWPQHPPIELRRRHAVFPRPQRERRNRDHRHGEEPVARGRRRLPSRADGFGHEQHGQPEQHEPGPGEPCAADSLPAGLARGVAHPVVAVGEHDRCERE